MCALSNVLASNRPTVCTRPAHLRIATPRSVLAHPRLEALVLESGRCTRLRIHTPQLTSLRSGREAAAGVQSRVSGRPRVMAGS